MTEQNCHRQFDAAASAWQYDKQGGRHQNPLDQYQGPRTHVDEKCRKDAGQQPVARKPLPGGEHQIAKQNAFALPPQE